jgi:antibiotic biosynthesis monooxygenase (ABM) superfamily enzyme
MTAAEDIEGSQKGQIVERRYYAEGAAKHHSKDQNLTVFAKHKVVRGKEQQYMQWTKEINSFLSKNFQGYQGAETVRPTNCESNEYVNIFRFDNYEHLQLWMDSEERLQFLERTNEFDEEPIETSYHSLEYWFVQDKTDDKKPAQGPPSKEKMVVVTFLLIWLQVHFLGPAFGGISELPGLLAEALTVLTVVIGTTYLWMPLTTKYILHWWLFPNPDKVWYFFDKKENGEGVISSEDLVKKHSFEEEQTEKNLDVSVSQREQSSDAARRRSVEEV